MTLSKKRVAVAAIVAGLSLGCGQQVRAEIGLQRRATSSAAVRAAPVQVHFRPQAVGGGAASGGASGQAAAPGAGAAGAQGGTGAGTPGAAIAGGAAALPGAASGQPGPAPSGSPGGVQIGGLQFGGAVSGAGQEGLGGSAGQVGELPPAASSGRLTPIIMQGVREPIGAADISVELIGTQVVPEDQAAKQVPGVMPLPGGSERGIGYVTYRWQAANIYHWPLYFEEPMLERHGQQAYPIVLQPAVSGAKFFSNIALYPYKATLWPAFESRYTLGHFRPGSPVPLLHDTLPWSPRAALVQGAAVTGVFVGLPW